ncbi:MAG: class I SAM-dependent methyltransferase [Thermoplasmata archaeon]
MAPIAETFAQSVSRRLHHLVRHPIAWARYVWTREVRGREVTFRENPRFLDWRPMYEVARPGLLRLTGAARAHLDAYFDELAPLQVAIDAEAGGLPSAGALIQAPLLYLLVRAQRPERVIETGISSGYSARLILEAMERNGAGHLDSIGVDVFAVREEGRAQLGGRGIGWLVPERLHPRWTLLKGRSDDLLPGLLARRSGAIDLFLHDSLHQYATMHAEYATAFPCLAAGGYLASHDIHANRAWPDFLAQQGLPAGEQLDHDLGVVRVPVRA